MRAYSSLQRQGDFTRLYRRGKRFSTSSFTLYAARFSQNSRSSKIGISVSKAVGKAVQRNLVRRRVQCAFDALGATSYAQLDLLVVAKPGAAQTAFATVSAQLATLVSQARQGM